MLKGHVFSKQFFGNPIFALFVNTFLDGNNGVSNNYKNGMQVTYNGSNVTVDTGVVCIQGRFLEEDSSTSIAAGTDSMYCKLVIEIDLDKENTDSSFLQGAYKIVKSASSYPTLTQTNIVKNVSGIYQYELARFRTSSSGITEFQDMRTFLDFDSIYAEIEQKIQEVEDGSIYILKNNLAYIESNNISSSVSKSNRNISYPDGFNKNNTCVISIKGKTNSALFWQDYQTMEEDDFWITFYDSYITLNNAPEQNQYQIILMKIDFLKE